LTSERLATSSQDLSRYHIAFETAHTILAQACVSNLLQLGDDDEEDDVGKNAPLAVYGAEYWVRHAQFEDVASRIKGMEYLFDVEKPYFAAWRRLHDIDIGPPYGSIFAQLDSDSSGSGSKLPLYYAALCGFANLVEHLIAKHPQQVTAIGGYYRTPAVAALAGRYFQLAQLLHRIKSSVEAWSSENTPLHSAAWYGDLEMVQVLHEYGFDVNAKNSVGCTPLTFAIVYCNDPRVARLLIEHGADPNSVEVKGITPLHAASMYGRVEIVRFLIERGVNVEAKDDSGRTPLDFVSLSVEELEEWAGGEESSSEQRKEIIKLLSEHCTIYVPTSSTLR